MFTTAICESLFTAVPCSAVTTPYALCFPAATVSSPMAQEESSAPDVTPASLTQTSDPVVFNDGT